MYYIQSTNLRVLCSKYYIQSTMDREPWFWEKRYNEPRLESRHGYENHG